MRALLIVLVACAHPAPKCPSPPPVTIVAPRLPCTLPKMPAPSKAVGFPSADGQSILISKSDWSALAGDLLLVHAWIDKAQACLSVEAP